MWIRDCRNTTLAAGAAPECALFGGRRVGDKLLGLLMGDAFGLGALRNLGVLGAIGDIGTVTAIEHLHTVTEVGDVLLSFSSEFGSVELECFIERDGVRVFGLNADK